MELEEYKYTIKYDLPIVVERIRHCVFVKRALTLSWNRENFCSPSSETSEALLVGGVGGAEDLIEINAIATPKAAKMNQTMLSKGISTGCWTNKGVTPWPSTIPMGWDIPITAVAKGP